MKLFVALTCLALTAGVAAADDKVLVLRSEGRADKKIRTKIEVAILALVKTNNEGATAGDITYGDAAAMVGCKPEEEKCKEEVLGMLSVDEIVTITSTPKPGGIEVSVRRIGKGGSTKTASTIVSPEKAEQLDSISPLFNRSSGVSPLPPAVPVNPTVTTTPPTREPIRAPVNPTTTPPPTTIPRPTTVADPTTPTTTPVPTEERRDDDRPRGNRRLHMIGMAAGGTMLIVGVIFWASAKNIEDEIANAPTRTRQDLENLQDLEQKGDDYAAAGNILSVAGLVVGGVSTYFFIRGRQRASRSARITPTVNSHGAGLAITWGAL